MSSPSIWVSMVINQAAAKPEAQATIEQLKKLLTDSSEGFDGELTTIEGMAEAGLASIESSLQQMLAAGLEWDAYGDSPDPAMSSCDQLWEGRLRTGEQGVIRKRSSDGSLPVLHPEDINTPNTLATVRTFFTQDADSSDLDAAGAMAEIVAYFQDLPWTTQSD